MSGKSHLMILTMTAGLFAASFGAYAQNSVNANLIKASKDGISSEVRKCIELGASPMTADDNGFTPLMAAASNGHDSIVKYLVSEGADLNAVDSEGRNALMYCVSGGYFPKVIKFLLENGSSINAIDKKGNTALMLAAKNGHDDAVKELLAANAKIDQKNKDGKTALDIAHDKKFGQIEKMITNKSYLNIDIWK